uniref:IBH1-like N-terminal domain-containing protein n=1 Tax=Leersia perrieri TaxID=77586 RepID=A0A0D9VTA3_9ORYZ
MASTSGSAAVEERGRSERKRKRGATGEHGEGTEAEPYKWRTRRVHEIYSSKLLDAIRLVRSGSPSASSSSAAAASPPRSRAVREAADRALAVSARGRTRWSRAILASHRRRIQAARRARLRDRTSSSLSSRRPFSSSASSGKGSKTPALARKAKVLGRLVPGCRKLPFPALLAEASDYIAALEMQVRAMTALAEVLSTVSASSSGGGSGSSSPA